MKKKLIILTAFLAGSSAMGDYASSQTEVIQGATSLISAKQNEKKEEGILNKDKKTESNLEKSAQKQGDALIQETGDKISSDQDIIDSLNNVEVDGRSFIRRGEINYLEDLAVGPIKKDSDCQKTLNTFALTSIHALKNSGSINNDVKTITQQVCANRNAIQAENRQAKPVNRSPAVLPVQEGDAAGDPMAAPH